MGSGKSFIADKLGRRLGIRPLRSDVVRKQIHGLSLREHQLDKYGEGFYTSGATERTYRSLMETAEDRLRSGESVIVDASFSRRRERQSALDVAIGTGARFRIVHCSVADEVAARRLVERSGRPDEPSDGRLEVFAQHKAEFDPIQDHESEDCRTWDSTTEADTFLTQFAKELMFN